MVAGVDIEQSSLRQRGFIAAGAFVALIALAGAVVVIAQLLAGGRPAHHRVQARVAVSAAQPLTQPSSSPAAAPWSCRPLAGGSQAIPTSTPTGTRWSLVGDMAAPSAPGALGPERLVDGLGECYAHSPLGALYGAYNVMAAFSAQPQSTVIGTLGVSGRARDVAVAQAQHGDNRELQQVAGGPVRLIAFQFSSYSPQTAVVSVALQGQSGVDGSIPLTLQWTGSDWRFVVPPDGEQFAAGRLASLAGFVPWAAG